MSSFFKSSGTSVTIQNTIDTLITDAEAAKIAAQTAATNASTSASLSSTSANNSSTSATNSASSLSSAQSAQGASETARDASVVAKNSAETAATNSGNSASTASTQASNASTSATNASNSATTATTKASEASTSATNAASSASTASGHVTTASTQASNASTSATNAASSASTATTKASEASTSATNASTSASTATTKASEASTSATNASTSASTASTQATNAGNSATASANSATAAGNSATAAASSASTAQTLSTSFNNIYLGALSSAPSQDPDGSALDEGDLYFDTTQGELKVYKSSGWAAAGSTVNGTSARFHYDISGTPNSVSGADAAGNTLAYDAGFLDVYVNGVRMSTADITTTSGNAVVFAEALSASDEVDIVAYGTFVISQLNASNLNSGTIPSARVSGAYTGVTSVGTLSTLNVQGETTLQTHLNMGDGDTIKLGASADLQIYHDGSNSIIKDNGTGALFIDGSNAINFRSGDGGEYYAVFNDDGAVSLRHNNIKKFETTSTGVTVTGGVTTTTASSIEGGAVFNEASADVDFRVEGNTDTHALFVQGGSDHVGINNNSPNSSFTGADNLVIGGGSGHTGMTILSGTSSRSSIEFSDGTGSDATKTAGGIRYYHDSNYMRFNTNGGTERMRIDSSGRVGIGATSITNGKLLVSGSSGTLGGISAIAQFAKGATGGGIIEVGDNTAILQMGSEGTNAYLSTGNNALRFLVNSAERMRIDSLGNVGIGTNSPNTGGLHVEKSASNIVGVTVSNTEGSGSRFDLYATGSSPAISSAHRNAIYQWTGNGIDLWSRTGDLHFGTNNAERARIDTAGNFIVGMSATSGTTGMYITQGGDTVIKSSNASSTQARFLWTSPAFADGSVTKHGLQLYNGTDAFEFGYISDSGGNQGSFIDTSGTDLGLIIRSNSSGVRLPNGGTSWSSYSDSRLKDVTGVIPNALDKIDAMRGVLFSWKDDEENTQRCGVIAQEVQAVLPEVIDADTDYLQVRYSEMIPLLIQGIKEQKTIIESLTARITTLEGE